jgi:transcriptional regulator with XRE-family HTH domain
MQAAKKISHAQSAQSPAVGARLKEIRYRSYNTRTGKHYTQAELAAKWGCVQSSLKNYETNRRETPHRFLILYARLVEGYTVDYILTGQHPGQEEVVKRVMRALK